MNRIRTMTMAFAAVLTLGAALPIAAEDEPPPPDDTTVAQEIEEARRALAEAARRVAELSVSHADRVLRSIDFESFMPIGVRLGVELDRDSAQTDGVQIAAVVPDGPAARAGLQSGDLLLTLNDRSLAGDPSEPALRRVRGALREAEPGDTAAVTYRRGRQTLEATVTLEAAGPHRTVQALRIHPDEIAGFPFGPGADPSLLRGWSELELVRVSDELGRYFGTDSGLLVVRAPDDNPLTLRGGDVILEIDGRAPQSPTHAVRILRSYAPGETVTLSIMRERQRQTIEATVPERRARASVGGSSWVPVPPRPVRGAAVGVVEMP